MPSILDILLGPFSSLGLIPPLYPLFGQKLLGGMLIDVGVRPAQAKDLSELATLACSAFKHDPIYSMLHPYRALDPTSFRDWKHRIICSCFYDPLYSLYVLEGSRVLAELGKEKKEKDIVGYVVLRWHRDHDREWEWRRKQTWVACRSSKSPVNYFICVD